MTITTTEHLKEARRRIEAEAERNLLRAQVKAAEAERDRLRHVLRLIASMDPRPVRTASFRMRLVARAALSGGDDA